MKAEIEIKNGKGCYLVYVHGEFYCSCDSDELSETIREIEEELKNGKTK